MTAETNLNSVVTSTDGSNVNSDKQWVTESVRTQYASSIEAAKLTINNPNATQKQVDDSITELANATQTFNNSKQLGTKGDVNVSSASNSTGSMIHVLLGGTPIPLPNNQDLNGVTVTGANTIFTVQHAGQYELSYDIHLTAAMLVSSRIIVNGASVSSTVDSPSISKSDFNGSATVSLAAGDKINLQLYGLIAAVALDSANPTTLTIKKIN
ncbi:hypothetical protein DCC39_16515 [Pueribacillus theae]|uniref:BclA C-terminal domain-containing protein n=1 Tax=Pueribacillus theae TaxID=2171751 RepID=A0A2U1JRG1_9BACI|nr:hypothetical protein [Pueribacillus theae]PWA07595.1 hypothetical protein DCC39_16515 [Pueribacillus theae]